MSGSLKTVSNGPHHFCTDGVIKTHHLPPNLQKSDDSPPRIERHIAGHVISLEKEMISDA